MRSRRHITYQARLRHSPDAIYPDNHVTARTPHASIFDAGLAAHETRLLRHVGSTAVFMKTPCSRKIEVITIFYSVTLLCLSSTHSVISQFTVPYSIVPPEVNPAVLIIGSLGLGRDFAIRTVSMETGISRVFLFSKAGKFTIQLLYNKLFSSQKVCSRRIATSCGQYSTVRLSRSIVKRLEIGRGCQFVKMFWTDCKSGLMKIEETIKIPVGTILQSKTYL